MNKNTITISAEQQKLIASAIRIQILHILNEEPLTAKQVATKLNKSPGSIHYHVQLLYEGGLLELVDTKERRGIIEKYYKAKAVHFSIETDKEVTDEAGVSRTVSHLFLNEEEHAQLMWEVTQVLLRWESKVVQETDCKKEYQLTFEVKRKKEEGDS
ncbi:helix-turn-helix domain-containing protein [Bacillus manliponensis]|uniref:helix-turn-helix domain-containing protein n=1 Tax=Bacillus manliponensis TaxID=574376 RepID=UPI00351947C7